jgi:formylglycine-generating enzyme required for sulfatase activity
VDSYVYEDPRHLVTLAYGFWMGKYEVTQQQWIAVRGAWPGTAPQSPYGVGSTHPAYYISWNDAKDFIASLNAHIAGSGQGPLTVRLPSEAEWEYACRGGTATRFYWGDDSGYTQIGTYAWYSSNNSPSGSKAVGGKTGNALGLFDMSGNVAEWCEDDYHGSYTGAPTDGSAWIDSPRASGRMARGGGASSSARHCRSAYRSNDTTDRRVFELGFRLAAVQ